MTERTVGPKVTLESVFSKILRMPGVKVRRRDFLRDRFRRESAVKMQQIIAEGPIAAGWGREDLKKQAQKLLKKRAAISTAASVGATIPGGLAAAMTIDFTQFYGIALRLAQEIAYLYGEPDLWELGDLDTQKVKDQLLLYLGVMLGVRGAAETLQMMAAQRLGHAVDEPLEKINYKNAFGCIAKNIGVELSKELAEQCVHSLIPVVGGIISGGITFASMRAMGMKLITALDKGCFAYTAEDYKKDIREVLRLTAPEEIETVIAEAAEE